jgi:hypothetical protein
MKLPKLTKAQINEALKNTPIHEVLNVPKRALTPKQIKYCENVAKGETKAGSYRKAYNSKANPRVQANKGYELSKRDDIQMMIEATRKAIEWEKSHTLSQTRALVVERLTKEALDDDSSPSARINALKALGTVAGVDAFVHRTETKVIKDSSKIRADLMAQIKEAMQANTIDIGDDLEAIELLAEISGLPRPAPFEDGAGSTPPTPDPTLSQNDRAQLLHTIPDTQSPSKSISAKNAPIESTSYTHVETLPHRNDDEEGGGGTKNHPDWQEVPTGNTPPSVSKTKG